MPPLRSIPFLSSLSTRALVKYLTEIWQGKHNDTISGLKLMPKTYLQEILESMAQTNRITSRHVTLLLDTAFADFNFSGHWTVIFNNNDLISRLCDEYPQTSVICMPFNTSISSTMWCHMVRRLVHLQRLDLTGTSCNDQVMEDIACNCPLLQHLAVEGTHVSDKGLTALYQSKPGCRSLHSLVVTRTQVTSEGVGTTLRELRQLKFIDGIDICDVIYQLHGQDYICGKWVPSAKQYNIQVGDLLNTISD